MVDEIKITIVDSSQEDDFAARQAKWQAAYNSDPANFTLEASAARLAGGGMQGGYVQPHEEKREFSVVKGINPGTGKSVDVTIPPSGMTSPAFRPVAQCPLGDSFFMLDMIKSRGESEKSLSEQIKNVLNELRE